MTSRLLTVSAPARHPVGETYQTWLWRVDDFYRQRFGMGLPSIVDLPPQSAYQQGTSPADYVHQLNTVARTQAR